MEEKKKLFISYSHHYMAGLAARIADDLEKLGYTVWQDDRRFDEHGRPLGITGGVPFDIAMENGIKESDVILFLMSTASVAESSVCRKEIIYGYSYSKQVLPVRLEQTSVPIFVCDISYIDFVNGITSTHEIDEGLYKRFIEETDNALNDLDKYRRSRADKLSQNLLRSSYRPTVIRFVGREWLTDELKRWVGGEGGERLAFLVGGPGTGKSAFLSKFTLDSDIVKSVHFCTIKDGQSRKASDVLLNWAYYLASQLPDYKEIIELMELDKIRAMEPEAIFERLFVSPLRVTSEKFCLIADSLDEMDTGEGRRLTDLLKQSISMLPENISIIVSAREETDVIGNISDYYTVRLSVENNRRDTRDYIISEFNSLEISYDDAMLNRLIEASECNFLYLYLLFNEYRSKHFDFTADAVFPKSLYGILSRMIRTRFDTQQKINYYSDTVCPILNLLAASVRPLSYEELISLLGIRRRELNNALSSLGSILSKENGRYTFFHKSMREYLTDEDDAGVFLIDPDEGEEDLLDVVLSGEHDGEEYIVSYALVHVVRAAQIRGLKRRALQYLKDLYTENPEQTVKSLAVITKHLNRTELEGLVSDVLESIVEKDSYFGVDCYINDLIALRELSAARVCVEAVYKDDRYYSGMGDILLKEDDLAGAKEYFLKALEISEANAEKLTSYQTLRNLSISYTRLGNILFREDDLAGAKECFLKALELFKVNAEKFPSYESLRDLSLSYTRLGDILLKEYDLAGAKECFLMALKLDKTNAEKLPGYESLRILSIIYIRLGDILLKEDDRAGAKECFLKALEIVEANAEKLPGYQSLRDLSISYNRLGDILLREDDRAGAKEYYLKALEISEENADKFPSYESLRDLSISYTRLGNILLTEDDCAGAKEYYLKSLEISETNAEKFPGYDSLRDLSLSYERLGDILLKEDNRAGAKDYYLKVLEIGKANAEKFTGYEGLRSLSISYKKLGDILLMGDDCADAKKYYLKALEIDKANAEKLQSYDSLRALSISYSKLGDILLKEDARESAKEYYLKALELDKANAEKLPGYESLRDLSVSYEKLGDILLREDSRESAKEYYLKALEIRKANAEKLPSYQSLRDLSVSYIRLGNILLREDDRAGAKEYYLKALEITKANAEKLPGYESLRDLSYSYICLAKLLIKEDDEKGAIEYYSKYREIVEAHPDWFPQG